MTFDVGQLISALFLIGSIIAFYWKGQNRTDSKFSSFQERMKQAEKDIKSLETEVGTLSALITRLAVIEEKLSALQCQVEAFIDDFKRGFTKRAVGLSKKPVKRIK